VFIFPLECPRHFSEGWFTKIRKFLNIHALIIWDCFMTIRKRLIFTLGRSAAGFDHSGGFGIWRLSQTQQRFELVRTIIIPSTKELTDANDNVSNLCRLAYGYLVSAGDSTRASTGQEIAQW
jgi:methyl-accepting chemotaxis protein-1 (serine sensor receptor)